MLTKTNATKIKENTSFGVQVMRTIPLSLGPLAIIKKNITGYTSVGGWKQQHIPFWQCLHHSNSCSNPETEVACILPDCQLQCQWLLWAQTVLSHHTLAQLTTSHCGELQFPIPQVYPFHLFVSAKYAFIKLMLRMYPPLWNFIKMKLFKPWSGCTWISRGKNVFEPNGINVVWRLW